jgi:hypothetical protein
VPRRHEIHPGQESVLTKQEQRLLLERVVNSNTFQQSPTLRAFILYVGEHALAGRLDEIKEQQIGWHVLGRKEDYDTANDNIVRIRARQVRQKLEEYFATEGSDSPWMISIPKGAYEPVFQARPLTPPDPGKLSVPNEGGLRLERLNQVPLHAEKSVGPEISRRASLARILPWLITAVATMALFTVLFVSRAAHKGSALPSAASRSLWGQFFPNPGKEVTVVVADSAFALWQDFMHRNENLGEYVGRSYLREPADNADARGIAVRPYTSLADVILTLQISRIATLFGGEVNVKHTRNVEIHDFSNGDVVLLGSRRSDPWVELFEPYMNFVLDQDGKLKGPCFRNRSPKPGEPNAYLAGGWTGVKGSEESYAVAALRPNLEGTGHVLILEGLDMEGTEAAGEFVCNPAKFGAFLRATGAMRDAILQPFEALIKLRAIPGGYEALELVAFRYGPQT